MAYEAGLSGYDGRPGSCSLHRKPFASVGQNFFWWIHRFSSNETILDIGFGDREFIVETALFYPAIEARFALWELLLALKAPNPLVGSGNAWVLSTDYMERTVAEMAEGIRKYWPVLSVPNPSIVDRARELRGRRLIFAQEEQRRRDRERASIRASRAFHEHRFEEAIRLLTPFKDDEGLSRASKMLFLLAQKKQQ
jgi:hypothetical protein